MPRTASSDEMSFVIGLAYCSTSLGAGFFSWNLLGNFRWIYLWGLFGINFWRIVLPRNLRVCPPGENLSDSRIWLLRFFWVGKNLGFFLLFSGIFSGGF